METRAAMHGNRMKGGRKEGRKEGVNELRAAAADNIACVHLAPPEKDEQEKGGLSLYSAQGLPERVACDFVARKGKLQGKLSSPVVYGGHNGVDCGSFLHSVVIFTRREATRTGCLVFG